MLDLKIWRFEGFFFTFYLFVIMILTWFRYLWYFLPKIYLFVYLYLLWQLRWWYLCVILIDWSVWYLGFSLIIWSSSWNCPFFLLYNLRQKSDWLARPQVQSKCQRLRLTDRLLQLLCNNPDWKKDRKKKRTNERTNERKKERKKERKNESKNEPIISVNS